VIYDVLGWVLQQGVEEGEVRNYPAEGKGSARVEFTMGRDMAARRCEDSAGIGGPVARRGHEVEERKGGVRSRSRRRRKMGWGGKGGAAAMGCPFKWAQWGGGSPREGPRRDEEWGGAWGPARCRAARCDRQQGSRAAHVQVARYWHQNRGGGGLPDWAMAQ
jgi:hypothetical protein